MPIHPNDRVYHPEHPEYGYGIVRLIEESVLSDERICQVAFEWAPGLLAVAEDALKVVPKLESGRVIQGDEWSGLEELQRRLGAALVMAENSQSAAFIRSFTMPLPHQAFLLEKILAHRRFGHVIADDVGMGKTIEAGLIIATLRQRDPQCRVLVLCPAGVVLQWQDEMDEHFGLTFSIAGRDFTADRAANWTSHTLVLASLDTLKQERLRDTLKSAPPFDLVVCDEAHRLTARREFLSNDLYRTQNYRFVEWLVQERVVNWELSGDGSPRSPRLVLMSATPHQGDDLRFAYLLQLARPDKIEAETAVEPGGALTDITTLEECLTRTAKKRAVDWSGKSIFLGHETRTLDVPLTVNEKTALQRLARYVQSEMVFKESKGEALVRALAMHTFQKIAASSWAALKSALASRLEKAGGGKGAVEPGEEAASMAEDYDFLGGVSESAALDDVLKTVSAIESDSKWQTFQDLIRPGGAFREDGDRILIFTQYRVTQSWLAEQLKAAGEKVMQIHGGLNLDERKAQRIAFESEGTVLISTEAGSEGANLHRQCHLMVNYDLPWNPMRLLQRIGRLDRYGQKHRVKVANLKAPESWDAMISQKIEAKLATVQASMGLVADEDYRTMILGSIHEAISVPEIIKACAWSTNERTMDESVDEAVQTLLSRKSSLDSLFRESLGMPENYGQGSPNLTSDAFRQVFAWAAAGHGTVLRETRTSDNKFLKGVYHFTLPEAFRGGLRPSRECHLVFDRDQFAEVRNTSLGRVRGQEIKPTLAGFGDAVTDWFFKGALQASDGSSCYSAKRPETACEAETWWIVFAARWKGRGAWAGPDSNVICALDGSGNLLRVVEASDAIRSLQTIQVGSPSHAGMTIPNLIQAQDECRKVLRNMVDPKTHGKTLSLQPLCFVSFH
ncbi:MAG: DEAD/DEAH box helicase [Verrucomicrobia bacterium]|nr:DEAD/DEAH box helicase [Verrucomicrobiota bacterium]